MKMAPEYDNISTFFHNLLEKYGFSPQKLLQNFSEWDETRVGLRGCPHNDCPPLSKTYELWRNFILIQHYFQKLRGHRIRMNGYKGSQNIMGMEMKLF